MPHRENIVKTRFLRLAAIALLVLAVLQPAAAVPAVEHLAWDRVGSPIQIRA
jgi:hypothetical protein